jgi:sugar phosphate permease
MFMANAFKALGEEYQIDDMTLTIAGSLGALLNGISRIFWPVLQDRSTFKKVSLISSC